MKLIKSKVAAKTISKYYEAADGADEQIEGFKNEFLSPALRKGYTLFDRSFYHYSTKHFTLQDALTIPVKHSFLTKDLNTIKAYGNQVEIMEFVLKNYVKMLDDIKTNCTDLIKQLRKDYHFENE